MEWYMVLVMVAVGLVAGFLNTLAGGGSLLSLPLLIFLGLPANVANSINRIPLVFQNSVAVASFSHQKAIPWRKALRLAIPALAGAVIGAQVAADLNEAILRKIIGFLLVFMFFLILYKPEKWLKEYLHSAEIEARTSWLQGGIFFIIGFYGGFIQAGVGFFLLAALVLGSGLDLVRANAVKVLIILVYNCFALVVFSLNGLVFGRTEYIVYGLILAVGNMAGAFIASRVALSWGPRFLRLILLAGLLLSATELTGLLDLVFG